MLRILDNPKRFVTNLLIIKFFFIGIHVNAQDVSNSSEILLGLQKLNVLGSVLYLAAHPDDENSAVLSYMSKSKLVNTAYLSLTRGDGGQNLIGSETGDLLGVLRTQELLSARRIDGADQFFTRAIDFGYSKTSEETLSKWDRNVVLADIVKIVRQFKPDIIITRFSRTNGGHGHHLSSAILAEEAFYAASDPTKFPEQLDELDIWQPKRIYWNTWSPSDKALSIDVGEYNALLGKSYNEISAKSRSMHKSQGFGVTPNRGSQKVYFDLIAGESTQKNLFDNIDLSWNRVEGSQKVKELVSQVIADFNPTRPESSVQLLLKIYTELDNVENSYWRKIKKNEVKNLIRQCSGLWFESTSNVANSAPGGEVEIISKIIARSNIPIKLQSVEYWPYNKKKVLDAFLSQNKPFVYTQSFLISENDRYLQPYWLIEEHGPNMFKIPSQELAGKAENTPSLIVQYEISYGEQSLLFKSLAKYKWNDAVNGEQTKPFVIIPSVSLLIERDTYIFATDSSQVIRVNIEAKENNKKGTLFLDLPDGWQSHPETIEFALNDSGEKKSFDFKILPTPSAKNGTMHLAANIDGKRFENEIIEIDYSHISPQIVLKKAETKLVKLDIKVEPRRIGYIMGSGDEIPDALTQLGYMVELIDDIDLEITDLSIFDVIICGIRAFNTREDLIRQQKRLNEFVKNGGTWIVQHNTRFGIQVDQIGPYQFSTTGRDRISQESASLKILYPDHQLFNYPNKIDERDFESWVQERGLYFASSWDNNFTPLLEGNDHGESPKQGSLLYSEYGEGVFIFTALSWFRQLPAGVPGSYRLFVNLVSASGGK